MIVVIVLMRSRNINYKSDAIKTVFCNFVF